MLAEAHLRRRTTVEVLHAPGLPGVLVHRGLRVHDEFKPHFHAEAHIAFIHAGARVHTADRQRHAVGPGDLLVIPPGEVHSGASPDGDGWSFAAIYATPAALAASIGDLADEPGIAARELSPQISRDCAGGQAVLALAAAMASSTLAAEIDWLVLLAHLLRAGAPPPPARRERTVVRRVRAFLDEHLADAVTLDQLTSYARVSKEYLVRSFTADLGVPPHTYQINARVERAKLLLLRGDPISEVAQALGFHDQSHLTRHFRRIVGVPPGLFAPSRRRI